MFLIQDGHQAHTRVEPTISAGDADGVVWSLADQTPGNLDQVVGADHMRGDEIVQAIDPQLYVAPLADANPKKLLDHALFTVPMRPRDFSARNLVPLVETLLAFQADRPVTHLISPTVPVASMVDRWAGVASDLADTSLATWDAVGDGRPLLVSVAIQESLLADAENVDALLDELTAYECDGFYLLLELDPRTDPAEASTLFEQALYLVHTLSVVNEYTVWVGYAGLNGYPFRAVGAEAFGGGWWQKQNWWSPTHWTPGAGGRTPRPRIYLESILGSLLIDNELRLIARQRTDASLFPDVLHGAGALATDFADGRPYGGDYDRHEMTAQLFAVCSALDGRIVGDVETDLRQVLNDIAGAEFLYRRIRDVDVQVEPGPVRNAPVVWQTAITSLGGRLGLALSLPSWARVHAPSP
jgi:hypothetical protein